jgi:hypothetical protein
MPDRCRATRRGVCARPAGEFYDSAIDSLQTSSLHASASPRRARQMERLHARLEVLKTCAGDVCRAAED